MAQLFFFKYLTELNAVIYLFCNNKFKNTLGCFLMMKSGILLLACGSGSGLKKVLSGNQERSHPDPEFQDLRSLYNQTFVLIFIEFSYSSDLDPGLFQV